MDNQEIEKLILSAIEANQKPPLDFILAVLSNEIVLSDATMDALIAKGWINRQKCEVWTRVMGYFRPVSQFNVGKKAEFAERAFPTDEHINALIEG